MNTRTSPLKAISPLDGRYGAQLGEISAIGSEEALIGYRIRTEAAWLLFLCRQPSLAHNLNVSPECQQWLQTLTTQVDWVAEAAEVKATEKQTNHDVKAVEYFLRDGLKGLGASDTVLAHIHFGCTSEDINNVAYGLMLKDMVSQVIMPFWEHLIEAMATWAGDAADAPMLARTHGQSASPTTMGKEWAVFAHRLQRQKNQLDQLPILAKWSGAVGNYNAHIAAYPHLAWDSLAGEFLAELGLTQNPLTTQIENHDNLIEHVDVIRRFNVILLGFCRDIWSYVSLGYLSQRVVQGEVGSSTMPHKVNPIDFENAEGNLGLAIALGQHFAEKLPISRWQRDLSDSTVLRNGATMFGYSLLSYKSILKGIAKLDLNTKTVDADLDGAWEVLGEALQTIMRRYGISDAYERLKEATRGQKAVAAQMRTLLDGLPQIPQEAKDVVRGLRPRDYIGMAPTLVKNFLAGRKS